MEKLGAAKKALIFTESNRTLEYLRSFLIKNGYQGKIASFNGSNDDPLSKKIYQNWLKDNGEHAINRAVDQRAAIVGFFKNTGEILLATEAAAEGMNLQFCSLVINYDLPWNPQRIEQRIGRCHRYGQKHDVVVMNFLNKKNMADQRIYQILCDKFQLFDGVFGASDEILGKIEDGVMICKRRFGCSQNIC